MRDKNLIRQRNELTEACYSLSLPETRVLYLARYMVSKQIESVKSATVSISIYEYAKHFDCTLEKAGKDIRSSIKSLYNKDIKIARSNKYVRWLIDRPIKFTTGEYEITFSPMLFQFLTFTLEREKHFTKLFLSDAARLHNPYAIRLLSLFRRHVRGWFRFYIEDLIEFFEVPKSYQNNFAKIERLILQKAVDEIKEACFYSCEIIKLKQGKKVTEIMFQFKKLSDFKVD